MNVSDIQKTDGIWLMNLSSDSEDKSIKTEAGNRSVPIHPKLLELEFLSYVEQIRNANHKKLFPNLKKMLSTGYARIQVRSATLLHSSSHAHLFEYDGWLLKA